MLLADSICLLPVLAVAVHAAALATSDSSQTASATTAVTSTAACAQVSSYVASQAKATPKGTGVLLNVTKRDQTLIDLQPRPGMFHTRWLKHAINLSPL